jgi:hypothetical protein
MAKAF